MQIVEFDKVGKKYGNKQILEGITFAINKGEIVGLIGENGSGKTTIMKVLLGLARVTVGKKCVFGQEILAPKMYEQIGALIEAPVFYEGMTGYQNLVLHLDYMGQLEHFSVTDTLEMVGLDEEIMRKRKVKKYSLGMRQRLAIARAIIHKPKLVVLDEPINGLDPQGIIDMRHLFRRLQEENGMTFLISSHILNELEMLASKIILIRDGKIVSVFEINENQEEYFILQTNNIDLLLEKLEGYKDKINYENKKGEIVFLGQNRLVIEQIINENKELISGYYSKKATLEQRYLDSLQSLGR
ncbi:MAG: ATP-binding cassette domain-containing protein [Culicoidibacterales bacterium]